jgi:hypothetical protein
MNGGFLLRGMFLSSFHLRGIIDLDFGHEPIIHSVKIDSRFRSKITMNMG